MRALGRDDDRFGRAAIGEELGQRLTDGSDVFGADAEGSGREANLGDEVAELVFVEVHEPDGVCEMVMVRWKGERGCKSSLVSVALAVLTRVRWIPGSANEGAA